MGKRQKLPKVKKRDELDGEGGSFCPKCGQKDFITYHNYAVFLPDEYARGYSWYFPRGWRKPLRARCNPIRRRVNWGGPWSEGCGWEGPINELVKWGSHP